jgi:hypothetical protein
MAAGIDRGRQAGLRRFLVRPNRPAQRTIERNQGSQSSIPENSLCRSVKSSPALPLQQSGHQARVLTQPGSLSAELSTAATGAPQRPAAVAGDHGFGLGRLIGPPRRKTDAARSDRRSLKAPRRIPNARAGSKQVLRTPPGLRQAVPPELPIGHAHGPRGFLPSTNVAAK